MGLILIEQAGTFAAALDDGRVVYAVCLCTAWWLVAADVGTTCMHCGEPMAAAS